MTTILHRYSADNWTRNGAAIPLVRLAHPVVIYASLRLAPSLNTPIVIDAASSQVNQDGGYMGIAAPDFIKVAKGIAQSARAT